MSGLEPMGLFWSMEQEPGQSKGLRYWKRDVTEPVLVTLNVFKGHYSWDELYSKTMQPLVSTVIRRWYKAPDVKREQIRVGNIRGTLFLPPGKGPFLGVIDMFGSAGGLMEFRASLLASRGFACLALAYFGYEDLQKTLKDLNMDYFQEAVDWFMSHPSVIKDGIGVVSVSKGAEICQLLAVNCTKIHAAVLISGPPCCTALPIINNGKEVPTVIGDFFKFKWTDEGLIMRDAYNVNEYAKVPKIEIWKSNAKILNIVADDDQCAESSVLASHVDAYPEHLKCNIETVVYHDAGHLIEPPYSPFCKASYNKLIGKYCVSWCRAPYRATYNPNQSDCHLTIYMPNQSDYHLTIFKPNWSDCHLTIYKPNQSEYHLTIYKTNQTATS
ncbi:hypothetical protein KUTeg_014198 [Tegillarca granosa]|uniref:Uncharacterized protein n=1 Tax=Tegillarca granosa TaxID=220873 RepID=A0ABQ9EVX3_TEGGR|nr:hypothetical protein KUTeg_014198 [Tegillarca granosa]